MLETVEHVVADEGAGRLRDAGREARRAQAGRHGLDRQGAEVGGRAGGDDRLVHRPGACVVGDAGIVHIDRHPLQRQLAAPAGLAQREHEPGLQLSQVLRQPGQRCAENAGEHAGLDAVAGDLLPVQATDYFQEGLTESPSKGSKPVSRTFALFIHGGSGNTTAMQS